MTKLLAAACAALLWTGAVADDKAPPEPAPKAKKAEKAAPKGKPRAKAPAPKPAAPPPAQEKPCEPVKPCPID